MKKLLTLLVLITLPVMTFGQNASNDTEKEIEIITFETIAAEVKNEVQINSISYTKSEVTNLSYKKSNDLISIKAYRKSLQIRTKEVKSC